jgi:hypothetical protein
MVEGQVSSVVEEWAVVVDCELVEAEKAVVVIPKDDSNTKTLEYFIGNGRQYFVVVGIL